MAPKTICQFLKSLYTVSSAVRCSSNTMLLSSISQNLQTFQVNMWLPHVCLLVERTTADILAAGSPVGVSSSATPRPWLTSSRGSKAKSGQPLPSDKVTHGDFPQTRLASENQAAGLLAWVILVALSYAPAIVVTMLWASSPSDQELVLDNLESSLKSQPLEAGSNRELVQLEGVPAVEVVTEVAVVMEVAPEVAVVMEVALEVEVVLEVAVVLQPALHLENSFPTSLTAPNTTSALVSALECLVNALED